jgi:predicted hotdog family 3-hydroxylacyl-ACP dehydratase
MVELIPHRPPMLLVDEVIAHEGLSVVCRTTIREDMPFVRDGEVPVLLALELFAQSAASLVALLASRGGAPLTSGAILGSREIKLYGDVLRVGDILEIHCEERMAIGVTAQIACELRRGGELLAEGSINVMAGSPEDARRAMEGHS